MSLVQSTNVTVMVADLSRAIRFYTDTLGFALKNRYGDHWADIEAPGLTIGLHPTAHRNGVSDNLQLGLRVEDLDAAVAALSQKGVEFKPGTDDNIRIAFFKDPDGNTLYLVQPKW